jgi:hypothetical protein
MAAVDVQPLLPRMGLSRDELGALVVTRFVAAAGAIEIRSEKRTPDSVQNDVERVHGLTIDGLDRMHRLTRLRRHVAWSFGELDRALASLGAEALDDAALVGLATLLDVATSRDLGIDEASALAGAIRCRCSTASSIRPARRRIRRIRSGSCTLGFARRRNRRQTRTCRASCRRSASISVGSRRWSAPSRRRWASIPTTPTRISAGSR